MLNDRFERSLRLATRKMAPFTIPQPNPQWVLHLSTKRKHGLTDCKVSAACLDIGVSSLDTQ